MAGPVGYLDHLIIEGININPYVTSALTQYLKEGGVFLDIGANHGVLSLLAAKNPKIKVFAFEPSSRELCRLWKNLSLNKKNNISVFSYGIGDEEKIQDLVLSEIENTGMNTLPQIRDNGDRTKAFFASLHQLLSTDMLYQARLCKLDVEGQEMFILNGLRSCISCLKQCVFVIEMSPILLEKVGYSTDDIYQFFSQAGFQYQFGNPNKLVQWEEFFYHPEFNSPLVYSEAL